MKFATRLTFALLLPAFASVWAGKLELLVPRPQMRLSGALHSMPYVTAGDATLFRDSFGRPLDVPRLQTPFAQTIDEAWKKDASEANLKAWSEVLIKCQQATNPAWTTVLLRSESQQAHCYRY